MFWMMSSRVVIGEEGRGKVLFVLGMRRFIIMRGRMEVVIFGGGK